jgi:hypothetical protein
MADLRHEPLPDLLDVFMVLLQQIDLALQFFDPLRLQAQLFEQR